MLKTCAACKIDKEITEFVSQGNGQYTSYCKDCHRNRGQKYKADNPQKVKESLKNSYKRHRVKRSYENLLKHYGISPKEYVEMLEKQKNVCFICAKAEVSTYRGVVKRLAVDHDHTTGKVRALLCSSCNLAVGFVKEDFKIAIKLAEYIHNHKECVPCI